MKPLYLTMQRVFAALLLLMAGGAFAQASNDTIPGVGVWASETEVVVSPNPVVYGARPVLTAKVKGRRALFPGTVTFYDGGTAIGTVDVSARGQEGTAILTVPILGGGTHAITAAYSGDRLNPGSTSAPVSLVITPAPSTTVFSVGSGVYGQAVTLSASVTGPGPVHSGTVTFFDGATAVGSAAINSAGTASVSISTFTAGVHTLTANYSGDANTQPSTATATLTISKASTRASLVSSANPSAYGDALTLTANVAAPAPTGSVSFMDGATSLGSANINAGTASLTVPNLAVGTHSLTAIYGGDANQTGSTSQPLAQVVNRAATTATVTSNANPQTVGQAVTFTAVVSGKSPSGSVSFSDGGVTLGTASLSSGTASFTTGTLSAGSHGITVAYEGDTNNAPSTSTALGQTVNQATTTLSVTANGNPVAFGQPVTFTATLGGGINATGTITFNDGNAVLGAAALADGQASFTTNTLAAGTHSITATYAGDASNAPSASAALTETIGSAARGPYTWRYGYDAMGRVNTRVDPNSLSTYFYYDGLGQLVQTQQPANTGTSNPTATDLSWDLQGNLVQVTDPRSLSTRYTVNAIGKTTAESSPDRGDRGYTYDAVGNMLTSTDARGKTTTYGYDRLNRLKTISYATGVGTTFEYDGGASPTPNEVGKLTKMTDESGQTTYTHDALGRLTSRTMVIAGKSFVVRYGWGDSGLATDKLTSITYPSGTVVSYGYDTAGLVSAINVTPSGGTSRVLLNNVTYNADRRVTGWKWSDGVARTIGYDDLGMIASYTLGNPNGTGSAAGSLRKLMRDSAGRIVAYEHTNNGQRQVELDQTFAYDNLGRLTSHTVLGTSYGYSYDANGNRTSKIVGGTTYTYAIDPNSNKLTQVQDVNGFATPQYDAAGNTLSDGTNSFGYSDRGRMSSARNPAGTVSFLYSGANQRVYKSSSLGTSYYVYDGARLLGEYDANGNALYETIYFADTPVGVAKQGALYNSYSDQIGTPRMVTAQDHAIVWRWDSAEGFGATSPSALGNFVFNQRLPGQVFDAETGLNQNWNREYDARTGRYTQVDPIGLAGGINTVLYVGGSPLLYSDLTGLQTAGMGLPNLEGEFNQYKDALVDVYTQAASLVAADGLVAAGARVIRACLGTTTTAAQSWISGLKLNKQLASQSQMSEAGTAMSGSGTNVPFRDAMRAAAENGGNAADWAKKTSSSYTAKDGTTFETHWIENTATGQRAEFKTKFPGGD